MGHLDTKHPTKGNKRTLVKDGIRLPPKKPRIERQRSKTPRSGELPVQNQDDLSVAPELEKNDPEIDIENSAATHSIQDLYPHIHRWLDACNSQHEKCRRDSSPKGPEWVIDVANCCIVPGQNVDEYVALSYVWKKDAEHSRRDGVAASHSQRKMLFQSNVDDFQKPGFLHDDFEFYLPRIIKEAIELVRGLGLRYLWVDCLCIVQDAPDTRASVEKMDEVYSNAYFTIVAAVSSTLVESARPVNRPWRMFDLNGIELQVNQRPEDLYCSLQRSEWARRGWTFQEAILSRRLVVFLDQNLFWDCPCCVWNTTEPTESSPQALRLKSRFEHLESYRQAKDIDIFRPNFRTWLELICLYNQRRFTYPQDAIMAFSGILNLLSRGFSKGFVGGTPLQSLDAALMWQPTRLAVRRKSEPGSPSRYLPSWSCFGWQCRVDPDSLRSGLARLTQEDDKDHAASWATTSLTDWTVLARTDNRSLHGVDSTFEHCLRLTTKRAFFHVNPLVTYREIKLRKTAPAITSEQPLIKIGFEDYIGSEPFYQMRPVDMACNSMEPGDMAHNSIGPGDMASQWPCMMNVPILSMSGLGYEDSGEECSILWLSSNGKKVGLLRQTEPDEYFDECTAGTAYARIELIAISSGSATRADLSSALEENRDCNAINERLFLRKYHEEVGRAMRRVNERGNYWDSESTIKDDPEWWNDTYFGSSENDAPDDIIYFINVLWIERQGDVAIRKAAGRVLKTAWEEHSSGPVEIILA
ncbi:hypothetical protein SLS60_011513 [Paraconiothyrium brasiliense]|uniref:Heterokaryon incompatibility domain-containing protein n=1 Tax=Paraconiothyrium brasiliense TaxID=300254 RepID=A0ABR3QID9_9PLEO